MDKKTLEIQIKILADKALQQVKEFGEDIKNTADKAKGFTGDATKIATSIKSIQDAAKRTANQMKLFGLTSSDLRNTTQNLKKTILDLTESGLKPESREIQNLVEQYRELESQADKVEASEQGLFGVIGKLRNEIGSLAAVAAAVKVDKAVADLAKSSLDVNNSFQKIKDDFGIMLGDIEAGIGLFNELQEFNFWTPFDIEQTSQAAKVLVSAKVPLKDLTEYLTRFGDIAQGDAQKFQSYINAFSKASAKGKADMEVLNVYTDQGVQILDALGQQLGKTSAEIVKMASEGKISFQDLDNALNALASEGGLYYGTLEKAAMRLDAVQAGLDESVKTLKASFGQMLAPAVSAVLTVFTNLIDGINSSPILKGLLAGAIITIVTLINVNAVKALIALAAKLWSAYAAQMGLNSAMSVTNPVLLAVTATVAIATAGFVAYAAAQQDAVNETSNLAYEATKAAQSVKDLKTSLGEQSRETLDAELSMLSNDLAIAEEKLAELEEKVSTPHRIMPAYNLYDIKTQGLDSLLTQDENNIKKMREEIENLRATIAAYKNEIKERDFVSSLAEGNEILKKRNDLYEKTEEGRKAALEKQLAFAKSLYSMKTLNEDGTTTGFDREKTDAIVRDLEKELEELIGKEKRKAEEEAKKAKAVLQKWTDKGDTVGALKRQELNELTELESAAKKLYGETYKEKEDYIAAAAALEIEYDKKVNDERKKLLEKDLRNGNLSSLGAFASESISSSIKDSDLGNLIEGTSALGSAAFSLTGAFTTCLLEVENVSKIINWAGTIIEKVFEYIDPIINDILAPLVELMETVGETIGQILTPLFAVIQILAILTGFITILKVLEAILKVVGGAFEWFYNKVIVPVGNKIVTIFNKVIDALNKIPFVNIKKLEELNYLGEMAEEVAETSAKSLDAIKRKFERMKQNVDSILNAQLDALKSQYELGLISRQEYEQQAEKYAAEADSKIYDINKEMEDTLEAIENGTAEIEDYIKKESEAKTTTSGAAYGPHVASSSGTLTTGIYTPWLVDYDKNRPVSNTGIPVSVSVNVQGSVVTERELVDSVYQGIAKGIQANRYNALGAA